MGIWLAEKFFELGDPIEDPNVVLGKLVNFGLDLVNEAENPLAARTVASVAPHLLDVEIRDTALWPALFQVFPGWRWGHQATGDCTSWGKAHGIDVLGAVLHLAGKIGAPAALAANESIYGFAKCEVYNRYRRTGAGSTSWAVSEAVHKYGWLLRQEYRSGVKRVDLRTPTNLSIAWGNHGGGVPDWLEEYAAQHKAADRIEVEDADQAARLITAGYPVDYAGNCPWPRTRGADGIATRYSRGAHMMVLTGVRERGGQPHAFWCANTGHGRHVTGPVGPIDVPDVYAECGGWLQADIVDQVLLNGRCHAHTMIDGWPVLELPDWGFDYL